MKSVGELLLSVLAFSLVAAYDGQETNGLLAAHNSAIKLKLNYDEEVNYWREYVTIEAFDMGEFFGIVVADGVGQATTATQGAAIQRCAAVAAEESRILILSMDHYVIAMDRDGNNLHSSVLKQVGQTNVLRLASDDFYEYHNLRMEEAYNKLWTYHFLNIFFAWLNALVEFYIIHDELFFCIEDAIGNK